MTNCLGSVISVDCGEFGYYQGRLISLDAKAKDIVLASAMREGVPLGRNVTLNGAQIVSLKVLKAAHQVDPQVASTSSCSRAGKKERPQKAKGVDQNSTVMHKSKSAVDFKSKEKSRLSKQANSCEARPLAALQNKSTNVESQRKPSSLSSTSEEGQSTEINTPAKQNKRNKLRRSESEYVNSDSLPVSGTPRFRRFEPQVPLPREAVMAKVKNRGKVKGPSGNPLLDSKKLPGKVASGNSDLIKPVDFDLLNTDFDFDANLERFKKEDFDEEYYETVEKQKMSQNFAHYENIINDPTRCISWMNICGSNGTTERADACSKFATERPSPQLRSISFCPSSYETTYDGFPVPVLDAALKKKYLLECCASMGPDVFHYLVADRLIMWLIDVSGRFSISLDDIVVLASPSTPLRLIDRVLFHLDNRGARTNLFGRFTSSEFGLVSTVDRVSALPLAPKVIVMLADDLRADALIWLRKQTTAHVVSLECCPSGVDYRKLHVLMLGVLTSGIYCVPAKSQPQLGKTSFAELCATVGANKFIDSAVCDVGAPFSWIAEDGKASLLQAFSTTLMRRLC
ncbi:hypothetical protein KIN20_036255 [Parelaphostrongylus tenuis]|uniref:Lsm14-like N-terminal domain-containing protein n=1 Tax=Parelaphostrongylus tenuis TaxID=148309 RepID=A0AAD5RCX3_PARTN|nr:hypothetical protein KIN20_036255 [Parelaphostrongylus tenuis]